MLAGTEKDKVIHRFSTLPLLGCPMATCPAKSPIGLNSWGTVIWRILGGWGGGLIPQRQGPIAHRRHGGAFFLKPSRMPILSRHIRAFNSILGKEILLGLFRPFNTSCLWSKGSPRRKGNPAPYPVGGNVNWCSLCGKQYGKLFSQKTKHRTTIRPGSFTPGYFSERNKNTHLERYMLPSVHSNIICNSQNTEAS